MTLNPTSIREQFPALNRPVIYLDNPGGTQIARRSLERITRYLVETNANHGGRFATSRESDAVVDEARAAAADFLNAARTDEVVLGPNMTTLTFRIGRALAPTFQPGETLVVTRLDHDANVTPWVRMAEDRGMRVRRVDFDPETGMLDMHDFQRAMEEKPRLVALGYASNALGTINPVGEAVSMARAAGALTYIDAVQYAPHGPIDVQALGCDFLVCSAYKFFGPHVGVLYGRYDLLDSLRAYRVRPAPSLPPGKFETGTNNFEGIAGLLGALEYLEWVGRNNDDTFPSEGGAPESSRRQALKTAMSAIRAYEHEISREMLAALNSIRGLRLYGPNEDSTLDQRVPTFSFTMQGFSAAELAEALDQRGINTWDGNFYAVSVTERLGLDAAGSGSLSSSGLLRAGAVHYNTIDEVHAFHAALEQIAGR